MPHKGGIHFTGREAEAFLGAEIGSKVEMRFVLELTSVNTDEFGTHAHFHIVDSAMADEESADMLTKRVLENMHNSAV